MKIIDNRKGLTLIETILSLTLLSIVLLGSMMLLGTTIKQYTEFTKISDARHNARVALNYIEKRIRECNQLEFQYDPDKKTFRSKDYRNNDVWIDLSGDKRYTYNTLLYFYKILGELRVNKQGEHNVLIDDIKDIIVTEVIPGNLIEIEVLAVQGECSVKSRIHIHYRKLL